MTLDDVPICITTCRYRSRPSGRGEWKFSPIDNHRHMFTLLAALNRRNDGFSTLYRFAPNAVVKYGGSFGERSKWLTRGKKLEYLTQLFEDVRKVRE